MGRDRTDTWFFFGDSVTLGVNDSAMPGGWVSRLALKGAERGCYEYPPATFYNLGARRQKLADVAARFEAEYTARLMPGIRSRFAFCAGTVDALQGADPQGMVEALASLLARARNIAPTLFICPPPLADEQACARLERYAALAQEVCRKLNLPCANLFPELMARSFAGMLTDGIHPGPEGNELFASLLMDKPETVTFLNAE